MVVGCAGVGVPTYVSFIPDGIARWRALPAALPLIAIVSLIVGMLALSHLEIFYAGAPGSLTRPVWIGLTVLTAIAVTLVAVFSSIGRIWRRRSRR